MRRTPAATLSALIAAGTAATGLVAAPAEAATFPVSFACESVPGEEVVLSWDDVTYELSGTCGVVRVTADRAEVTLPTARRLVVEGEGAVVSGKSLAALEVSGTDNRVHTLRLRSAGAQATARRAYVVRVAGDANTATFTRADRLVVAGDANRVTVTRGRTVVRDRGDDNTVAVHRRR